MRRFAAPLALVAIAVLCAASPRPARAAPEQSGPDTPEEPEGPQDADATDDAGDTDDADNADGGDDSANDADDDNADDAGDDSDDSASDDSDDDDTDRFHQDIAPGSAFDDAPPPAPGRARNAVAGADPSHPLLWIPRALFFLPRWGLEAVVAPLRGIGWAYDRYNLAERFRLVFFNDAQTFGVFPVAFFETGFGLNAGARMVHKDLFGGGEQLTVRAGGGGRFQQLYRLQFNTGPSLGKNRIDATVEYQVRPRDRFFGIGNGDELQLDDFNGRRFLNRDLDESTPLPIFGPDGIDPLTDDTSIETRFSQEIFRAEVGASRDFGPFTARASAMYRWRDFTEPDFNGNQRNLATAQVYDSDRLIGLAPGSSLSNLYVELDLFRDTRRSAHPWVWQVGTGYRAEVFLGHTEGFSDDPSSYFRYGADLSYLIPLYRGDRILALRGYFEAVTAARDEIPFTDLPRLGGPLLLRGYDRDRYRDRLATMVTAEYQYPLARNTLAFVFTDIGRVYDGWDDFDVAGLNYTFGVGLQSHSQDSPQFRLHLGGSLDGDILVAFSFDPVFVTRPRLQRD